MIGTIFFFICFIILLCVAWLALQIIDNEDGKLLTVIIIAILIIMAVVTNNKWDRLLETPTEWKYEWCIKIVTLKDNSDIDGSLSGGLFYQSGYVNEKMYYYCMEQTKIGKKMIKIPAVNSYIIETNDREPCIVKESEYYTDEEAKYWLNSLNNVKYYIYVPENTVDDSFSVDLE